MVAARRSLVSIVFIGLVFCLVSASSAFGSATNIYITQNGSPSGNCTSNVQTLAFFNNASNWGSGATQIGPGATVLLCGTFTLAAGGSGFQFQGSGANGSPITLQFDTGAVIQAPYFSGTDGGVAGGAIVINGYNYITVDGQNTGVIQGTANGSNLANQQAGLGLFAKGDHILVKNLTIQGIYVNGSNEPTGWTDGQYSDDLYIASGSSNVEICGNTLNDAHGGIDSQVSGGSALGGPTSCADTQAASGFNYHSNTLSDHVWFIVFGGSGTANIYNNYLGPTWWVYPHCSGYACDYHTDGIFAQSYNTVVTAYIYNNYVTGDNEGYLTGNVYCSWDDTNPSTSGSNCYVFNNVLVRQTTNYYNGGAITLDPSAGTAQYIYNNTAIGFDNDVYCCYHSYSGQITTSNNIFSSNGSYSTDGGGNTIALPPPMTCSQITSDHNLYYNERTGGGFSCAGTYYTFSTWRSSLGKDTHGNEVPYTTPDAVTALNLNSDYAPTSSSLVIGLGANLTGLAIAPLDVGAPMTFGAGGACSTGGCINRASSWDVGAYEASSGSSTGTPAPPTNLSVSVN
jgi:hypothetical protein